jgi:kynurenine formamidase
MHNRWGFLLVVTVAGVVSAAGLVRSDEPAPKLTRADIDDMMKSLSNWGRWGKDDQLGTINLIAPDKRRQAAALVKEGVTVSLSHNAVKERIDDSAPFVHRMVVLPKAGEDITSAGDEYSVQYHGFTQTHLDGLCHLAYKGRLYNGYPQAAVTLKGAAKLGIQNLKKGIFTRCILMDMPRLFESRYLKGGHAIYPKDLEAWEKKAGVNVSRGDAVLIRTGRWTRRKLDGPWDIMKNSAGLHASCLPWLKKRDVALIGSDLALDVMPSGIHGFELPVHWVCIVAMGMPILDNCDLERLSEEANTRQRWHFLLTVNPLRVEGGTGSPANPVAVF